MQKKAFFKSKRLDEIVKLSKRICEVKDNIVEIIENLKDDEYVEINFQLRNEKFYETKKRKIKNKIKIAKISAIEAFKYGKFIKLGVKEEGKKISKTLEEKISEANENEGYIGFSFWPNKKDVPRVVAFESILEGFLIWKYTYRLTTKIQIYENKNNIICNVPSRTKKRKRYKIKFSNVNDEWYLKTEYLGKMPERRLIYDTRFIKNKKVISFGPHCIAGYFEIMGYFFKKDMFSIEKNYLFPIPNPKIIDFYHKLKNNAVIKDRYVENKIRKLNIDEISMILGMYMIKKHSKIL